MMVTRQCYYINSEMVQHMNFYKKILYFLLISIPFFPSYGSVPSSKVTHASLNLASFNKTIFFSGVAIIGSFCLMRKYFNDKKMQKHIENRNENTYQLSSIPSDLIGQIYTYCDVDSIRNFACISKNFNALYTEKKYEIDPAMFFQDNFDALNREALRKKQEQDSFFWRKTVSVIIDKNSGIFDAKSKRFEVCIRSRELSESRYYEMVGAILDGTLVNNKIGKVSIDISRGNYLSSDQMYTINPRRTQLVKIGWEDGGPICDGATWIELYFYDIKNNQGCSVHFKRIFNNFTYKSIHFVHDVVVLLGKYNNKEVEVQFMGLGEQEKLCFYTNCADLESFINCVQYNNLCTQKSYIVNAENIKKENERLCDMLHTKSPSFTLQAKKLLDQGWWLVRMLHHLF